MLPPVLSDRGTKRTAAPPPPARKFRSMVEVMRDSKQVDPVTSEGYSEVRCEQCRLGDSESELVLCDGCDKGFHIYCLRPIVVRVPTGSWFCPGCQDSKPLKRFPLTQPKILDFFRIQKSSTSAIKCEPSEDGRKRKRRWAPLVLQKRRRRLLPYLATEDPERRLQQMASLATALTSMKLEFSNELTYVPRMAPRYKNRASLEKGGMQVLPKEDKETLELCQAMYKRGECPPLMVVFDSCEGFTVQADGHIKDLTLITEYTGDVDYLKNRETDDCDSMMTLLLGMDPADSLVICPDKRGNIARFISGINNHTLDGRKKQNLKCVRYNVDGECRVLLVACRDISPGERLYYDYNGHEHEYPTHHFV
ncbi:putative Histone-lysine N-methyltransferase ATXR5 isoform X1 [Carex littledalei]|uniref:[histone H3]-lysine(27) N-methyltransferase n=1 Tax=Carex littledalei TaxID=544730 RepID=A0A833RK15_9POAL|nr:putative Histone-lysine N-methyltransferase ATXR5 isoform X1 [Carex littledalei]